MPSISFPGAYANQKVTLAVPRFQLCDCGHHSSSPAIEPCCPSDAVLVFIFDSSLRLLVVRHQERGWELPGGKRNAGECIFAAASREVKEETGGLVLPIEVIQPLAVYSIQVESDSSTIDASASTSMVHTKLVFAAQLPFDSSANLFTPCFSLETDALHWVDTSELRESEDTRADFNVSANISTVSISLNDLLVASSDFRLSNHAVSLGKTADNSGTESAGVPHLKNYGPSALLHDQVFPLCLELSLRCFTNLQLPSQKAALLESASTANP
jgi:8-oxo-dGTP pyrophosphatase MutT (NUDIX family)